LKLIRAGLATKGGSGAGVGTILGIILLVISTNSAIREYPIWQAFWEHKGYVLALGLFCTTLTWLILDIWIPTEKKYVRTINIIILILSTWYLYIINMDPLNLAGEEIYSWLKELERKNNYYLLTSITTPMTITATILFKKRMSPFAKTGLILVSGGVGGGNYTFWNNKKIEGAIQLIEKIKELNKDKGGDSIIPKVGEDIVTRVRKINDLKYNNSKYESKNRVDEIIILRSPNEDIDLTNENIEELEQKLTDYIDSFTTSPLEEILGALKLMIEMELYLIYLLILSISILYIIEKKIDISRLKNIRYGGEKIYNIVNFIVSKNKKINKYIIIIIIIVLILNLFGLLIAIDSMYREINSYVDIYNYIHRKR